MPEHVADFDALLPGGRELRPVGRHRRVQVEHTPIGEFQRDERDHRLGRRPDVHDRVALPGSPGVDIGDATPPATSKARA